MKKIVFFIPGIIFVFFCVFIMITTGLSPSPAVYAWILLFVVSGILLSKGKWVGEFLGFIPAIHLMYMSTKSTGQVIDIELPLGIIVLIFYIIAICIGWAHTKLDFMGQTGAAPCMANKLNGRYSNLIHSEDVSVLIKQIDPDRVDAITVGGKDYQASYFGKEDI